MTAFAHERPLRRAEAIELARCVIAGKASAACPIPFSYLFAAVELSRYLLAEEEIQKTETLPPPWDRPPTRTITQAPRRTTSTHPR